MNSINHKFLIVFSTALDEDSNAKNIFYVRINILDKYKTMIEPLLCGIVLGLVPITLLGLFVSAWNQYRRGSGMLDFALKREFSLTV